MQGNILLVLVTLLWGGGFVATKFCLELGLSSGLIVIVRGGLFMVLTFAFFAKRILKMTAKGALIGFLAGAANAIAYLFQCVGLENTTPSVGAFLTVLYVVIVPLLMLIFFRRKPKLQLLPAIILSLVGTYFLTGMSFSAFTLGKGELLTLCCALFFGISITIIGVYGQKVDSAVTAFWMGATQTVGGLIYFFVADGGSVAGVSNWGAAILPLLFMGIFCTFITTNAQVISQKVTDETTASIIMTLEALFGSIFSLIFGYDTFTWRLALGGVLILVGAFTAIANFEQIKAATVRLVRKIKNKNGVLPQDKNDDVAENVDATAPSGANSETEKPPQDSSHG